jgi:hypothetical protein
VYIDFWRETALHLRHELAQRTAEVQRLKVEVAWAANQHGAGGGGGGGGGREVGDGRGGGRAAGGGRGGGGRERGRGGGGGGGVSWWEGTELSRSWDAVASAIDGHTGVDRVRQSIKVTQVNGGGGGGGGGGGVFGQEKENSVSSVKENFVTNELPIKAKQFANYFAHGGREAEKASDLSYSGASGIANTVNSISGNTGRTERAEKASDLSHSLTASSVPSCVPKSSVLKLWKPAETPCANSLNSVTNSLNSVTNSFNSVTNSPKLRQLPHPTTTPPYAGHPSPRERGGGRGGGVMKMPLTQLTGNSQPPVVKGGSGGGGGEGGGGGLGGQGNGQEEWIQRVIPAGLQFFR